MFGYEARVTIIPDMDIGVYVQVNGPDTVTADYVLAAIFLFVHRRNPSRRTTCSEQL